MEPEQKVNAQLGTRGSLDALYRIRNAERDSDREIPMAGMLPVSLLIRKGSFCVYGETFILGCDM